ncbi:MAG: hypothetical protein ACREPA_08330 [Candidatus Dormibacteraceae bacterium]
MEPPRSGGSTPEEPHGEARSPRGHGISWGREADADREGGAPERYFERRRAREAIAFAEAGGIAVHRNFDHYHGTYIRGLRREMPFLHVIGRRDVLEAWGRREGLRPEWIQPERRRRVAHYDVFGEFAIRLLRRLDVP